MEDDEVIALAMAAVAVCIMMAIVAIILDIAGRM